MLPSVVVHDDLERLPSLDEPLIPPLAQRRISARPVCFRVDADGESQDVKLFAMSYGELLRESHLKQSL